MKLAASRAFWLVSLHDAGLKASPYTFDKLFYRGAPMTTTEYTFDAVEFVTYTFDDILAMVDLDTDVLHAFTPALLRAWLSAHSPLDAAEMKNLFTAAMGVSDNAEEDTREGFVRRVTDRTWLATLATIAGNAIFRQTERLQSVEIRYIAQLDAKIDAEREAKVEAMRSAVVATAHAQRDEAVHKVAAEEEQERVAGKAPVCNHKPVRVAEFELEGVPTDNDLLEGEETIAKHDAGADLHLPTARTTQLTLPHIIMRSPIIAIRPRNSVRPVFTDDEPLRIARVIMSAVHEAQHG